MNLTKSQKDLVALARDTPGQGVTVSLVRVQRSAGLSHALKALTTGMQPGPRVLSLYANTAWEAVLGLSEASNTTGQGYNKRIRRALAALSGVARRPVTLMLRGVEVGSMPVHGAALLMDLLEHACEELDVGVQMVLLARKRLTWDAKRGAYVTDYPAFNSAVIDRIQTARAFEFTRTGLEEVTRETGLLFKVA